jgi:hypothetical protein
MHEVEYDLIRNKHIPLLYAADIMDTIHLRQFRWLGKLARQPNSVSTKRLLSACLHHNHLVYPMTPIEHEFVRDATIPVQLLCFILSTQSVSLDDLHLPPRQKTSSKSVHED